VTDVETQTGRALVDSKSNEVVVRDASIRQLLPFEPMTYAEAVTVALQERAEAATTHSRVRQRATVAATSVVGATLLNASLSTRPGSWQFYALTSGVAATWAGGAVAAGGLSDATEARPPAGEPAVVTPVLVGVGAFAVFYACAHVARRVPVLADALRSVLTYARDGRSGPVLLTTLANGAAEEVFFRGALFKSLGGRHPVALSTAAYTGVTTLTRNPALVLAAAVMGTVFGKQREASGSVQAPMITHLTWSALMLRYVPPLFGPSRHRARP
jgi:membrane protease YdiL (CAAX protease family)